MLRWVIMGFVWGGLFGVAYGQTSLSSPVIQSETPSAAVSANSLSPQLFLSPDFSGPTQPKTLLTLHPEEAHVYPRLVYTYTVPLKDGFSYPKPLVQNYPIIDVTGFHEVRFSGRDFNPKDPSDPRFEIIRRDPYYEKLPRDVLIGSPQFDMRYQYSIAGQLDKDLKLSYDVSQERDLPGQFDVKVQYKRSKIQFGFVDTYLADGELIAMRKSLNGWQVQSETDQWQTTFATGQLRSNPSRFEGYGNGTRLISLGARSILTDSVKIWVNRVPQVEGRDYTVNWYQGEITFREIRGPTDYIVIVYEFTNPVEDFIPGVNRKQFIGAQFLWQSPYQNAPTLVYHMVSDEIVKPAGTTSNFEFQLKQSPVILASEIVKLNGRPLRFNRDYILKPTTGKLVLTSKQPLSMSDQLSVSYKYYDTDPANDTLIAKNSPGPYQLSRFPVVDGSVSLTLQGLPVTENIDYTIDNDKGWINFRYVVNSPQIIRASYRAIQTQTQEVTRNASPFTVGITYATEYTPQETQARSAVVTDNFTAVSSNILFLNQVPVDPSQNIQVIINDRLISSADYKLDSAYLGKIILYNPPNGVFNASVSYTTIKSSPTTYPFRFRSPIANTYLLNELRDLPVQYNSVRLIRVQPTNGPEYVLSPSTDFTVDYGQDGQVLNITFKTRRDSPAAIMDTVPTIQDNLIISYSFTPPNGVRSQGTLSQQELGFTVTNKWNDAFKSSAELVISDHNYSRSQTPKSFDAFSGSGLANDTYALPSANLVENSESVFLNGFRLNRDADYTLNYALGRIRFLRYIPGPQDQIKVNASVFDPDSTQSGDRKQAIATKIASQYQTENLTVKGDFKFIDRQFVPLGQLQDVRGSTVYGGSVSWNASSDTTFESNYVHRDTFANTFRLLDNAPIYLRRDDFLTKVTIANYNEWFDMSHALRWYTEVQDPDTLVSTQNPRAIDTFAWEYIGKISTGNTAFRHDLSGAYSEQISDYLDLLNKGITKTEKLRYDNTSQLPQVFLLGDTRITPYFEYANSQTEQKSVSADTTLTLTTFRKVSEWGFASTSQPYPFLPITSEWHETSITTRYLTQSTLNIQTLKNGALDVQFLPTTWLSSGVNFRHRETESPLIGQTGLVEDQRTYALNQLQFNGVWNALGIQSAPWYLAPFYTTGLSASRAESDRQDNNGAFKSNSYGNTYALSNIVPLPGVVLRNYSNTQSFSKSQTLINSETVSDNSAFSDNSSQLISFNILPPLSILQAWGYTLGFESRQNNNRQTDRAPNATSNITVVTSPFFRRSQELKFNPGRLKLPPLIWLPELDLGSFGASLTESLQDQTLQTTQTSYAGTQFETPLSSRLAQDASRVQVVGLNTTYSPFNLFNSSEFFKDTTEFFSRNFVAAYTGTTHKKTVEYGLSGDIPIFSFLTLNGSGNWSQLTQYTSPSLNAELDLLKQEYLQRNTLSSSSLTQFLGKDTSNFQAGTTWKFWSNWVYSAQAGYTRLDQNIWNKVGDSVAATGDSRYLITQKWGSLGSTWLPLSGLSLGYTYTFKFSNDSQSGSSQGYTGTTLIQYTPIKSPGFSVNISFRRDDTWGQDFNTLDIQSNQQASGATLISQIVNRSDTVEVATLGIDINMPMRTISPVMDKLVITGEGYFRRVTDRLDADRVLKNSYDLSGMLVKGTLFF